MIYMTTGRLGSGMTFLGTPPVENSNPSGASEGADGQGVCTVKWLVHWWLAGDVVSLSGAPRTGTVSAASREHAYRISKVLREEPGIVVQIEGLAT